MNKFLTFGYSKLLWIPVESLTEGHIENLISRFQRNVSAVDVSGSTRYQSLTYSRKQKCKITIFVKIATRIGLIRAHFISDETPTELPDIYEFIRGYISDYYEHAVKISLPDDLLVLDRNPGRGMKSP